MAKPKTPNQKKKYKELDKRLKKYVMLVERIYDTLNLEAAKAALRAGYSDDSGKPFKWSDYPQTKAAVDKLQSQFVDDIGAVIYRGTSEEWKESNLVQDLVADRALVAYSVFDKTGKEYKKYYSTNQDALKAFQKRKIGGLGLSEKLWNMSAQYMQELELALSLGIQKGTSANVLAREIQKSLNDPDKLFRRVRNKYGNLVLSKNAKAYHPGQGNYRSSFRNARRLAASEINMAYRTAEQERWRQFDFVVGYEIKPSGSHYIHDICDELAGKYPKSFKWVGWHPLCSDYCVPIMKTEDEFWAWDDEKGHDIGSVNEVKDVPDNFKQWVGTNSHRINDAEKRGTLPYFIKDNKQLVDDIITGTPIATKIVYKIDGIEQLSVLDGSNYGLTKAVSDVESKIRMNKAFETGVCFDMNGNIVIDKRGGGNYVQFTKEECSKMKDCIFTHNHPGGWKYPERDIMRIGNSFSVQDISLAIGNDLSEIRAVTPDFTFSMRRPENGWNTDVKEIIDVYNKENSKLRAEFIGRINSGTMTVSQAESTHFHILWKRISDKMGFEYKKLKTK